MPTGSTLSLFVVAALALLLVPGPAVLYIVTRSIDQGRTAGLVSVLGIHAGSVVHVAAAVAGVSAVLATSAAAFTTVKLAGAAYLVWIGVRRLTRRTATVLTGDGVDDGERRRPAHRRLFAQGVVVNVLNPKTAVFFLAFLPQFVDADRGPAALQVLVLGLLFIAIGMCTDGAYALVAGSSAQWLRRRPRLTAAGERASGAVYIGLGATAALAGRPATAT